MKITRRQRDTLRAIQEFEQANGYVPTLRELGMVLGITSLASVHRLVRELEKRGRIQKVKHVPHSISILKPLKLNQ